MRWFFIIPCCAVFLSGCVHPANEPAKPPANAQANISGRTPTVSTNLTYIPVLPVSGRVVFSNPKAKFVVLSLAPGVFPAQGTRIFAYRNGKRVGELRIGGPQWDDKIVADILEGDPISNDQISDN